MIFFLIALVVLGLVLQHYMGSMSLERVSCAIRADQYLVEPGDPFPVTITVENHSRLPILFLRCRCSVPLEAELIPGGRGELVTLVHSSEYQFDCFLLPRQRLEHTFQLKIPKRGGYRFTWLKLSAGDFLGLKEETREHPCSCSVVVLPKRPEGTERQQVFGGLMGERSVNRWIHEDPILSAGFREYTGREPQKTISWNRSLQSGRLMVRQMDHTAEEKVTVLFNAADGNWDNLEYCFSLCRGVCEMLEQRQLPYAFLHNGMLMTSVGLLSPVEAGLGRTHLNRILEGLGRAVADSSGSLASLVHRTLARGQDSSCYLLITPGITAETMTLVRKLETISGGTVQILLGEAKL